MDEAVSFHEMLIVPMRNLFNLSGVFYFGWVVPATVFVIVFAVVFSKFLFQLPLMTRMFFTLAAVVYVGGALGFEYIEGWYSAQHGWENFTFRLLVLIEEIFEMSGVIVFIYGILGYMSEYLQVIQFEFK